MLSSGGIRLVAVLASAPDLDDGPDLCKAGVFRRRADAFRKLVVVDVRRLATAIANQEDAVVETTGMLVGDIGVGAFDAAGEVGPNEQVEDPVDAVGRYALAASLGYSFGDVIRRRRTVEAGKGIEHGCAHFGPLLAALDDPASGRIPQ